MRYALSGEPQGMGRPRAVRRGAHVGVYTPGKSAEWTALAVAEIQAQGIEAPMAGLPVEVRIEARFSRPKRLIPRSMGGSGPKSTPVDPPHVSKPDVDNVAKAVLDALVRAGALADDRQVVHLDAAKRYCDLSGELPGVRVEVLWQASGLTEES